MLPGAPYIRALCPRHYERRGENGGDTGEDSHIYPLHFPELLICSTTLRTVRVRESIAINCN